MDPAEARTRGDATPAQRAELRTLIEAKAVTADWVQRFYADVRAAQGLSRGAANAALIYLRRLADKTHQPTYATPQQGDELRGLLRTRLVPARLAKLWTDRAAAGTLTYDQADLALKECRRLPLRTYVAVDGPHPGTSAASCPDGYFALIAADGKPRAYRIHTVPGTFARVVEQITGEKRHQRRRLRGYQATLVMREIAANPAAAAKLHGEFRHRCSACNQHLSDTEQPGYPNGYGKDCWETRQAAAAPQPDRGEPCPAP